MNLETKTIQTTGPALADTLKRETDDDWRCQSMTVIGAGDYELSLVRVVEQLELPGAEVGS